MPPKKSEKPHPRKSAENREVVDLRKVLLYQSTHQHLLNDNNLGTMAKVQHDHGVRTDVKSWLNIEKKTSRK